MPQEDFPPLAIITAAQGAREGDALLLDTKALEGLFLYARHWPGPVRWLLTLGDRPTTYATRVLPGDLPFSVVDIAPDRANVPALASDCGLILAAGDDYQDLDLAAVLPGKIVYVIEYTLRTRLDILRVEKISWPRKLKSLIWNLQTERRRRRAFSHAAGLQANGLPAYRAYAPGTPNAMAYFDTRLEAQAQIGDAALAGKRRSIEAGDPLRLAFSGRLERMKGAHLLMPFARALKAEGVDFTLDIYGDGALAGEMLEEGASLGITLHGAVPFAERLMPALQAETQLFICPHVQGDPSCTYMETLGCGVPIAGFANEAWAAMVEGQRFGVTAPVGDVRHLAREVAALDRDRARLSAMAEAAALFAHPRAFEQLFADRVAHLRTCLGR